MSSDPEDHILTPRFDLGPPNFYSIEARQKQGLCAIHGCPHPYEGTWRTGTKAFCRDHRERFDAILRRYPI